MKITYLFGGALTATQQAAVDHDIDEGNEVEVCRSIGVDDDFDLLVYGAGFGGLEELSNSVSFAEHFGELSIEEVVNETISELESVRVDDCCEECDGDCDEEETE